MTKGRHREHPKTFGSLKKALAYHKQTRLPGHFVVGQEVYWTYSDGTYCLTELVPNTVKNTWNIR